MDVSFGRYWKVKEEGTTCGEGGKAKGKPHPRGQVWGYEEKTKLNARSKVGL